MVESLKAQRRGFVELELRLLRGGYTPEIDIRSTEERARTQTLKEN